MSQLFRIGSEFYGENIGEQQILEAKLVVMSVFQTVLIGRTIYMRESCRVRWDGRSVPGVEDEERVFGVHPLRFTLT